MTRSDKQVDLSPTIQIFFGCNFRLIYIENNKFEETCENIKFHVWWTHWYQKQVGKPLSDFYYHKKQFHQILQFVNSCKHIFWVGYSVCLFAHIPQEGGWNKGISMSSSIQPNSSILIENLLGSKACQNNSALSEFFNSPQWKNMLNYFWSNAFDKVNKLTK
jgi:hypothetical protein